MIGEKNKELNLEKDAALFRESMLGDEAVEVDYIDRKDWRQKGSSDSDDDQSEYTEPGQSMDQGNPLTDINRRY